MKEVMKEVNTLKFATYNVLAPIFCRPKGSVPGDFSYFAHSSVQNLEWENRYLPVFFNLFALLPCLLGSVQI
jgi:hypothetical protein